MLAKSLETLKKSRVLNAQFELFWNELKSYMRVLCCQKRRTTDHIEEVYDAAGSLENYLQMMKDVFLCPFEEREKENLCMETLLMEKYGEDSDELYLYVSADALLHLFEALDEQVENEDMVSAKITNMKLSRLAKAERLQNLLFDKGQCEACVGEEQNAAEQDVASENNVKSSDKPRKTVLDEEGEEIRLNDDIVLKRFVDTDGVERSALVSKSGAHCVVCERSEEQDMVNHVMALYHTMHHNKNEAVLKEPKEKSEDELKALLKQALPALLDVFGFFT